MPWIYVHTEEEAAEIEAFRNAGYQLEEIDDSESMPDEFNPEDEGDPENEDDCVLYGWDLPK